MSDSTQAQLTKSFASAEAVAQRYPQYADAITAAARESFLEGDEWAYTAGPSRSSSVRRSSSSCSLRREARLLPVPEPRSRDRLLAAYAAEDAERAVAPRAAPLEPVAGS